MELDNLLICLSAHMTQKEGEQNICFISILSPWAINHAFFAPNASKSLCTSSLSDNEALWF